MSSSEYAEPIRAFIAEHLLDGRADLTLQTPLLEWGVIDSLTLVDLVAFIEGRFGLRVPMSEVTPESFATVHAVATLLGELERKSSPTAAR